MALAAALGIGVLAPVGVAEDESGTVGVELRVWQSVGDPLQVFLSARPEDGRWGPTERLPMSRTNSRGTFRYSDRTVNVSSGGGVAGVDLRVWQRVSDPLRVYLSARPSGGEWGATDQLPLEETNARGTYRFTDRRVAVPVELPGELDGEDRAASEDAPPGEIQLFPLRHLGPDQGMCALRESGEIICWWSEWKLIEEDHPLPSGPFLTASGSYHSLCAIRLSGELVCLRGLEREHPLPGKYTSVDVEALYACAVRESGEITCWVKAGFNFFGQANPPRGTFRSVHVGSGFACASRESEEVECWGDNRRGRTNAPPGRILSVSPGFHHACGLRESGEIVCWGDNERGQTDAPSGTFDSLSSGGWFTCGIRDSGEIVCWGDDDYGWTKAPPGFYRSVSAGNYHACALDDSGEIACWGNHRHTSRNAPPGTFEYVDAGGTLSCAIRVAGEIACWGKDTDSEDAPSGIFRSLSVGSRDACALRESGELVCWGNSSWSEVEPAPPPGPYRSLGVGYHHSCGIRESGELACWGNNDSGQTDVPQGTYRSGERGLRSHMRGPGVG